MAAYLFLVLTFTWLFLIGIAIYFASRDQLIEAGAFGISFLGLSVVIIRFAFENIPFEVIGNQESYTLNVAILSVQALIGIYNDKKPGKFSNVLLIVLLTFTLAFNALKLFGVL